MTIEILIIAGVLLASVGVGLGYLIGARSPGRRKLDALKEELNEARQQAERFQSGVDAHFAESAKLFGKLAGDYRAFLEHFADSAQTLGLSENQARALIEQGVQPLLAHDDSEVVGEPADAGETTEPAEGAVANDAEAQPADSGSAEAEPSPADAGEDESVRIADVVVEMPDEQAGTAQTPAPEPIDSERRTAG